MATLRPRLKLKALGMGRRMALMAFAGMHPVRPRGLLREVPPPRCL